MEWPGEAGTRTDTSHANSPRSNSLQTYQQEVQISFEEAYRGAERTVAIDGRRLQMKIPAGAKTGTKVRMSGAGPAGPDGQSTDLFLVIEVMPDPRFERKGDDLYTEATIDLYTAVLGGEARVQTLRQQWF